MRSSLFKQAILVCAAILTVACNSSRQPAEEALTVADAALADVSEQAGMYVPDELNAVTDAVTAAHAAFDAGDYAGALASAQALPAAITGLATAVEARKGELTGMWNDVSAQVATSLEQTGAEITRLAGLRRLPEGMTKESVTQAQADQDAAALSLQNAASMFEAGDLLGAIDAVTSLQGFVAELSARLNLGGAM